MLTSCLPFRRRSLVRSTFTYSNTETCAMTTWFVVEGEEIEDCTTTRERLSQLCFGNATRRCHAASHILHRNVRDSWDSFLKRP